jgi:hypothetical protein
MHLLRRFATLFLLLSAAFPSLAAPASRADDAQVLAAAKVVAEGERIVLLQDQVQVDPALLELCESALAAMEAALGRRVEHAVLGAKLRVVVSVRVRVSHVWGGYDHREDPQGVLFLNPRVAAMAVRGVNATYAHELAHLLTWRYHSHSLREGLADWLALQVLPGAAVGPNGAGDSPEIADAVATVLGGSAAPPAELSSDAAFRAGYYYGSRRLVEHLIAQGGIERFLELYAAADTEAALQRLYGKDRAALVRDALATDTESA